MTVSISLLLLATLRFANGQDSAPPGTRLFKEETLIELHLTLTSEQFEKLEPAGRPSFGPPRVEPPESNVPGDSHRNTFGVEFPWSSATLEFEGRMYPDIGLRYKGNYTYMATAKSLKKSLKLDLNRSVEGQKLDGLSMLNLHCGVSDPTMTREALSYGFFREAGVPAPRTVFAQLYLSVPAAYQREFVGVYTLTEQVNRTFLKRHFGDGKGMLLKPEGLQGGPTYLGDDWTSYEARYQPEDPPSPEEQRRLVAFARLISESSPENFAREIGAYLDIEAFLRFIAANTLLANLDSYLGFGHNYYLYLVPATNQFVFIPWDLDLSLATWPAAGRPEQLVELSIHHPHAGENPLLDRLFEIPEFKGRYLEILRELMDSSFRMDNLLGKANRMEAVLEAPRESELKAIADRNENRVVDGAGPRFGSGQFGQSLPPRLFFEKRIESVKSQLDGETQGFEPLPIPNPFGNMPARPRPGSRK